MDPDLVQGSSEQAWQPIPGLSRHAVRRRPHDGRWIPVGPLHAVDGQSMVAVRGAPCPYKWGDWPPASGSDAEPCPTCLALAATGSPAGGYEDLSISGLLAIALLGVEDWLEAIELRCPGVDALLEHLWEWPTIGPDTFRQWDQWTCPALEFALGGSCPPTLASAWSEAGLSDQDARDLLGPLADIVYAHLFGAIERDRLLSDFATVRRFLEAHGVLLRPPVAFQDAPVTDKQGWGFRLEPTARDEWRNR